MGHVGLTPQSVHRMGGYRVQGRGERGHARLLRDARAVQEAGAFAVVLECVPGDLAREISAALDIPTIGIGAGVGCDGQVLVIHDLIGLSEGTPPRFVREYVRVGSIIRRAARVSARAPRPPMCAADRPAPCRSPIRVSSGARWAPAELPG